MKELSREQIQESFEPFSSGNVSSIRRGDYKTQKVAKIVLEIMHVEIVGNCYQVKMQDLVGEEIQATFHSDCKEAFSKQIRRGKILVLQNVRLIPLYFRLRSSLLILEISTLLSKQIASSM
jgi:hypothetical protein